MAESLEARMGNLRDLSIERVTIDEVSVIEAKPNNGLPVVELVATPEVCRVMFTIRPTDESEILVELWLPTTDWNGCFLGTGNGGQAGEIFGIGLINGSGLGFAVANTDMGSSTDPSVMVGAFERIRDFGGRATHLMTVVSRRIIQEFYGRPAERSYFLGTSTGGQQALSAAQDYPEDYDGIVAICPAHNRVRLHTSFVWNWQALTEGGEALITPEQAARVTERLVQEYGSEAGGAPGDTFLPYPDRIEVDWNVLSDILTDAQLAGLRAVAGGPVDPETGERIFGPYSLATDIGDWYTSLAGRENLALLHFPFKWLWGADFDPSSFDMHRDFEEASSVLSPILDATSPDLTEFRARGGKLLLLSGTADQIIPYHDTVEYYQQVLDAAGGAGDLDDFIRFFLVPGMGHGFGGPGAQDVGGMGFASSPADPDHHVLLALKEWVEAGRAPERILAVSFKDGRIGAEVSATRPVFPYPAWARYVSGDPALAESYESVPS